MYNLLMEEARTQSMPDSRICIRTETPDDYTAVERLIKRAFWNVNSPGCCEHYTAHCMRSHPDFLPQLSLVLEAEGRLAVEPEL